MRQPEDVLPEIIRLVYAGNFQEAIDHYHEESVMVESPGVLLKGKHEIEMSFRRLLASGRRLTASMEPAIVCGKTAFSTSSWQIHKNEQLVASGRATDVLALDERGHWKMVLDNPFGSDALQIHKAL